MTVYSLDFRSTSGGTGSFTPESAPNDYVIGDLYGSSGVTRNGLTFGWSAAVTKADRASATDARLAGRNNINTAGVYFQVTLPNGPGTYRLWIAQGALTTPVTTALTVEDGGTGNALLTIGSTTPGSGQVTDASGAVISQSTYLSTGGTYVDVVATQDHLRFKRSTTNLYLANIQIEPQITPLVDATLTKEDGTGTHAGVVWAQEPARRPIGKLASAVGTQNFSVITGGTYYTVETRNGFPWLVTTGTRIPNGWSGNVVVRQDTGTATRDTTFALTSTSITRETTGVLGQVPSVTMAKRAEVKTVMDAEKWAGYSGQAFASDQVATSTSDFTTKFNALTPDGTSWYRIRLQSGTWTGTGNLSQKNFGTGGLLIEPDTGHDPVVRSLFTNCVARKVHWRNTILPVSLTAGFKFIGTIPGSGPYPIWKFSGNRIGEFFDAGYALSNSASFADFCNFEFVEQAIFENNTVVGVGNVFMVSGGRIMSSVGNTFRNLVADTHRFSPAYRFTTPRGVFADDITYAELRDNTTWDKCDTYTGLSSGATPHGDNLQIGRTTSGYQYCYSFTATGMNGGATPWVVGAVGFNAANSKLYICTVGGLIDTNNKPTGTGTGIVSGTTTWNYLQDYTIATTMKIWMENVVNHSDGVTTNVAGASPDNQFFINSNQGFNNSYEIVAINCIGASVNNRGIEGGFDGDVWASQCSFVSGAQKAMDSNPAYVTGRNVHASRCIVGRAGSNPNLSGTVSLVDDLNIGADFSSASTGATQPDQFMKGPFTNFGGGIGWGYPTLVDDGSVTADQFRSSLSQILHHLTGAAGARMREQRTITLTDGTNTTTSTLVILPN